MPDAAIRILIGCPVYQKPAILRENLTSLLLLDTGPFEVSFMFIDDNRDERSSELLRLFARTVSRVSIIPPANRSADEYVRTEEAHYWNEALVWKVASFKNELIRHAVQEQFDYLFLLDSDLVIHPDTLHSLVLANKDIVSEIFWTRWQPNSIPQPQVWLRDEYEQFERQRGEKLSDAEAADRCKTFIARLKIPGLYEVGGLGACTLISRQALSGGVHFGPISNLSFWGEDRHFCIRAAALGFKLFVDTNRPAYHIYRDSDLPGAEAYRLKASQSHGGGPMGRGRSEAGRAEADAALFHSQAGELIGRCAPAESTAKLTLTMVVKDEGSRYLRRALASHLPYIDAAVIIDDGSSDDTPDICQELLRDIPLRLIRNTASKFVNEVELRKQQWSETVKTNPQWILNLDADEIFEARFADALPDMLNQTAVDLYCFRLFDFWSETHYREDSYWRAHLTYRPFLFRYRQGFPYSWKETPQHCGRFPDNIFKFPHRLSELRLKHLGWSQPAHRLEKFQRNMRLDPDGIYGWKEQVLSILDENPHLVEWVE